MKNKLSVKKLIVIFLSFHTATVVTFVYVMLKSVVFLGNFLLAAFFFVFLALITAYTVLKVTALVTREIADSMKSVSELTMRLKELSSEAKDNAKELEYRANLVTGYANTMSELFKEMGYINSGVFCEQYCGNPCAKSSNDNQEPKTE